MATQPPMPPPPPFQPPPPPPVGPPASTLPTQAAPPYQPPGYPPTAQRAAKKGLSCWAWGCIIGAIVTVLVGGSILLCCGGPAALWYRMFGGVQGTMAYSWLDDVRTGDTAGAGLTTVGGEAKAKELKTRIEDKLGSLQDPSEQLLAQPVQTTAISETTVETTIPVVGSKGSGSVVLRMSNQGGIWKVEDARVASGP
jgi:hypothetical protein